MFPALWAFVFCLFTSVSYGANDEAQSAKAFELVSHARSGIVELLKTMDTYPTIFPKSTVPFQLLTKSDDKDVIISIWQSFADYFSLIEQLESSQVLSGDHDQVEKVSFQMKNFAFVSAYAMALKFIDRIEKNPAIALLLNEQTVGLSGNFKGSYDALKLKYLNIAIASRFAAMQAIRTFQRGNLPKEYEATFVEDRDFVYRAGVGIGTKMTMENAVTVVKSVAGASVFPVQRELSSLFGSVKVSRNGRYLISNEDLSAQIGKIQPGDILLQRREWYLSNLGIPGFWTHAALYVGTPEERAALNQDPDVKAWAYGLSAPDLDGLLASSFPQFWSSNGKKSADGDPLRIIEAIGHGVVLTALEESAHCDSLVVLRPRLKPVDRAVAIYRAFSYLGRPYDYKFNFVTDDSLVCSELIYKSYLPSKQNAGLLFKSQYVAGSLMVTPNSIAENFSSEYQTDKQQFDMVLFLDGQERAGKARIAEVSEFLTSWTRPKWHIFIQK